MAVKPPSRAKSQRHCAMGRLAYCFVKGKKFEGFYETAELTPAHPVSARKCRMPNARRADMIWVVIYEPQKKLSRIGSSFDL